ncbi:MAG: GntG family PLP-dependent aldolase [Pygmaiobacter sp.]
MKTIDLRSDTLTLPTSEMLQVMLQAPLGDDGRAKGTKGEDPSAVSAEEFAATLMRREDALFVPSGTLGNTLCVLTHCRRGARVITADNMHLYKAERSVFDPEIGGMEAVCLPQTGGVYDRTALETELKTGTVGLVCIENSYNFEGGCAIGKADMDWMIDLCHDYGVPVHLDGARIFNAAQALQITPDSLISRADSVMFCVSKGLCAPIGSFVCGSAEWVARARQKRKLLGGQLRQVGMLAAAGEYALRHLRERLAKDNARAAALAVGISNCNGIQLYNETCMTNLVLIRLEQGKNAHEWIARLAAEEHVLAHYINDETVRFVTYRGITDEDIAQAIVRIQSFCHRAG